MLSPESPPKWLLWLSTLAIIIIVVELVTELYKAIK